MLLGRFCFVLPLETGADDGQADHDDAGQQEGNGDGAGEPWHDAALGRDNRGTEICLHDVAQHITEDDGCQRNLVLTQDVAQDADN